MLNEIARGCLKCKKPNCSNACPLNTDIPKVIDLYLQGEYLEAGRILFNNNPLSAVCSIVCPHENNCFGNCVLNRIGKPVKFYKIEQFLSRKYLEQFTKPEIKKNNHRVAIIGAGPAGMSMSIMLALKGFNVTLIDGQDKIGGVLRYGIPEFRLPREILGLYENVIKKLGIKFKPNTYIGSNLKIDDMFIDGYDAIFVAVGTSKPNRLGLLGETLGHVHYAIDYLKTPEAYDLGNNVVIIGAGNVAVDAGRMIRRHQPNANITLINNRRDIDVTATFKELKYAFKDGLKFKHLLSTLRINDDHIVACKVTPIENEDGTISFEEEMNNIVKIPVDSVIIAIGQRPTSVIRKSTNISTTLRGLFSVDENGMTDVKGVFAAGDVVSGPKTVVEAVKQAKLVEKSIIDYCNNK